MEEQEYRGQFIRVIATKAPGTEYWVARADIRFQDRKGVRFYPLGGPRREFITREAAEQNIIGEAKKLIDLYIKA